MLCTFTTEHGALIVRSDDIRLIVDEPGGTRLVWMVGEAFSEQVITGTAIENRDRIQQEELDLIGRVEAHRQQLQRRMAEGYPATPVQRGRT
jgi:hypothetical protein